MKTSTKILLALLMPVCFISKNLQAQNTFPSTGSAGIGTTTPDASSILEMKSTTQGMLMPRMTLTQRNAIANPVFIIIVATHGLQYKAKVGLMEKEPIPNK